MWRIWLAIRIFFLTLFCRDVAERVRLAVEGKTAPPKTPLEPAKATPTAPQPPKAPQRSDALTLVAALQREARFIDFIEEPLDGYSDAQVGAASRDVHRNCRTVLHRMFEPKPLLGEAEGAEIKVAAGFDPGRYRLVGKVTGEPPFRGRLAHPGWEATKCEVPTWSGEKSAVRVIAPAEVEL
ncbi:MAG: DUF2760 domain-containing protein [Patescibacteria group bacterium]|nr:DUF2760 domain-containing protein [Patescibacteria group bacterium]